MEPNDVCLHAPLRKSLSQLKLSGIQSRQNSFSQCINLSLRHNRYKGFLSSESAKAFQSSAKKGLP